MKTQLNLLGLVGILLLFSSTVLAVDTQDVFALHNAWINAFEQADLPAVDAIWIHTPDATLITVLSVKIKGWQRIRGKIKASFDLTGKTTITGANLVITVSGDTASATMDYRWSPQANLPLKATEYYLKENSVWKMIAQDGTGGLDPLRKNAEAPIKEQVQQALHALAGADIEKLAALTADHDFTYVALDGTVHQKLDEAVIGADLEKIQKVLLEVIHLIDDVATAHLTLTLTENNERNVQFVIKDFQLTKLDFAPKSLAIQPKGKLTTIWARIKTQTPD